MESPQQHPQETEQKQRWHSIEAAKLRWPERQVSEEHTKLQRRVAGVTP